MQSDGTKLRLLVGAATAVLLHLLIVPTAARLLLRPVPQTVQQPAQVPASQPLETAQQQDDNPLQQEEPEPTIVLGRDDAPETFSVAWIAWEDFQEMVGPHSRTHQPAVQQQVDPVPDAPVVIDATPPTPPAPQPTDLLPSSPPSPPSPALAADTPDAEPVDDSPVEQVEAQSPTDEQTPTEQDVAMLPQVVDPQLLEVAPLTDPQAEQLPEQTQVEAQSPDPVPLDDDDLPAQQQPTVADEPEEKEADMPAEQSRPEPQPAPTDAETSPRESQQQPQTAAAPSDAAPTSVPRDQSESDPAQPDPRSREIRPGQVITTRGIEIATSRPQFSIVARTTALPSNPLARISFDKTGRVVAAELLQRTGYSDIDGAVLASLYRWQASGEELEKIDRGFDLEIRIILIE